ncbi:hypothetical protein PVK64_20530, partial [Aliivibrio sp. S4TY2]|uniref:hypothetical protein n=1 Tax=unclassified Aliivibrio TaxID=2645654 RepID=UPI002379981C
AIQKNHSFIPPFTHSILNANSQLKIVMFKEDIIRIEMTMNSLVALTREQNATLKEMLETLTKTRTTQEFHNKRLNHLESDKTWLNRLVVAILITLVLTAAKVVIP